MYSKLLWSLFRTLQWFLHLTQNESQSPYNGLQGCPWSGLLSDLVSCHLLPLSPVQTNSVSLLALESAQQSQAWDILYLFSPPGTACGFPGWPSSLRSNVILLQWYFSHLCPFLSYLICFLLLPEYLPITSIINAFVWLFLLQSVDTIRKQWF